MSERKENQSKAVSLGDSKNFVRINILTDN